MLLVFFVVIIKQNINKAPIFWAHFANWGKPFTFQRKRESDNPASHNYKQGLRDRGFATKSPFRQAPRLNDVRLIFCVTTTYCLWISLVQSRIYSFSRRSFHTAWLFVADDLFLTVDRYRSNSGILEVLGNFPLDPRHKELSAPFLNFSTLKLLTGQAKNI